MIRFHLFGGVDLRNASGTEIGSVLSQPKRTALLAYLAAASPTQFVRRATLVAVFWPTSMKHTPAMRSASRSIT
jgi:DNA-binding SARP family transcriptional activator